MSETFLIQVKRIYFKELSGGARSPKRALLGMANIPDNREFTGKIVKIDLQAVNSPYNNRTFPYG